MTQKVLPQTATFEATSEDVYATGLNDTKLTCITTNVSFETNINFITVPLDKNRKIMAEMRIA